MDRDPTALFTAEEVLAHLSPCNQNQPEVSPTNANVGNLDRIIRIMAGLAILVAGYYFKIWWGLVGLVLILTAIVRFCPAYLPFGLNSCPREKK